ncbi:hypothetical protein PACTADRAFT_34393 [Pachysolen tannophilus NRRL Y-2460]|uniref:Symplekin/Pta1 N-terminal domain-containing protein n=1 Tax=Pachysolen tannophilus NRRL Y-2460 TaxID=669874 RepID=A0A1E4TSA6_PACTA|nr:hypothetical protein PACTADRAFT_34393 [Pachysolen tannophilus NRRL Y-2460]
MASNLDNLDKAKQMAFENNQIYPEVFKTILPIVYDNDLLLQKWWLNFLIESYRNEHKKLPLELLKNLSIQIIDPLLHLIKIKDVMIVQKTINLLTLAFESIFTFVLENPSSMESVIGWNKLSQLKQEILKNFNNSYPLLPLNKQTDYSRSIGCKLQTIQFIAVVVKVQLPSPPRDPRMRRNINNNDEKDISISSVPTTHPILNKNLEAEGQGLLDLLFNHLNDELIVTTPLFTAIETILIKIFKKRPNHVYNKLANLILTYESNLKKKSKFEYDDLKIRLIKRFNDRFNKILISFMLNKNFIKDTTLKARLSKKFSYVMMKNDEQKKRGILNESSDFDLNENNKRRRKNDSDISQSDDIFYNSSTIAKDYSYASLYSLINPNDKVNQIDLSNIPPGILTNMVLIALKKIDRQTLAEGLNIISERYKEIISRPRNFNNSNNNNNNINNQFRRNNGMLNDFNNSNNRNVSFSEDDLTKIKQDEIKREEAKIAAEDDDYDDDGDQPIDRAELEDSYNPESSFQLPPPKILTYEEKKQYLKGIINHYLKLANESENMAKVASEKFKNDNSELSKVAIQNWNKDSWLVLLTRLATRGLLEEEKKEINGDREDENLSDLIRNAIFHYFADDIRGRVDIVIEWLNEEWFSEYIKNEKKAIDLKENTDGSQPETIKQENEDTSSAERALLSLHAKGSIVTTPNYILWTSKVLDSMLLFLESNDRKIFIRLLSDLPYLNKDLVWKIKSLCLDPIRFKIGFQSIQFLIMYRPPVKETCIDLLKELYEETSEQTELEDLKNEIIALLKKFCPEELGIKISFIIFNKFLLDNPALIGKFTS